MSTLRPLELLQVRIVTWMPIPIGYATGTPPTEPHGCGERIEPADIGKAN